MRETCGGCKFWSEMIAAAGGEYDRVHAYCLSPHADGLGYTERMVCAGCDHREAGTPIDMPGDYGENPGDRARAGELMPTVLDIVKQALKAGGYDGLFREDCGCLLDDLAPCGDIIQDCEAGYKIDGCNDECGLGCGWHVGPGNGGEGDD